MTMKNEFLRKIEENLCLMRKVSQEGLCEEFSSLPKYDRLAFARAISFLGCNEINIPMLEEKWSVSEADRIQAARFMLLSLHLGLDEPTWSSYVIEKMWTYVLENPGGEFNDLYKALYNLLDDAKSDLSLMLARFIRAMTFNGGIQFLSKYKNEYINNDFSWMQDIAKKGLKDWQAYLFVNTLPRKDMSPEISVAILKALIGTQFWDDALSSSVVGEALEVPTGQQLLSQWINDGLDPKYAEDIKRIISSAY